MCVGFSQFPGHLPAVLALDRGQQSLEVASHALSHLGTAKVRPDPHHQFSQGLRVLSDDTQFPLSLTACLLCPFFGGHPLHLPEAFYHLFALTGTVVLEAVCKDSLDPPKEGLDRIRTVFAQRPCQAISNHFAHSLLETVCKGAIPIRGLYDMLEGEVKERRTT